jgi:hypothetical protein
MGRTINQKNFFQLIKLSEEGYVEVNINTYVPPKHDGLNQYETYLDTTLDEEGKLNITTEE